MKLIFNFNQGVVPRRIAGVWMVLLVALVPWNGARAQQSSEKSGDDGEGEAKLRPPKLEEFAEAEYPESALEAEAAGTVVLILTIDKKGKVIEATVEQGPGHGLNEAAREAAEQFQYRPAHRGDEPVRSRIRYRYKFELPEEVASQSSERDSSETTPSGQSSGKEKASGEERDSGEGTDAAAERGRVAGTVRLPGDGEPAVGAKVRLVGPEGDEQVVRTDGRGRFRTDRLVPGRYEVIARSSGGARTSLTTEVIAGETTDITVQLTGSEGEEAIEVTVRGESEGKKLERSARAVEVIDTERARKKSDDMGEVVAKEEGVGVRRTGGLGSGTRFSLNGLNDNQVRFFLDGVPLAYAGFPFGMANVPVNLVDRIDIYNGVVPVRFGADALGGAVDLVTAEAPTERGLRASYQVGSFDTHRLTLSGREVGEESGVYARANAFVDYARNDYPVDVEVADRSGQISEVTARRFHDTYRAVGGGVEVGVTDREWADQGSVRVFASDFSRDLQHNLIMSVPYGDVRYGETVVGGIARYEHALSSDLSLELAGGYNFSRGWLEDVGDCHYDWFGRCTSDRANRGELGEFPADNRIWEHAGFARLNGQWAIAEDHALRLTLAPTYVTRTGENRAEVVRGERDPLEARRELFDLVSGLELESEWADGAFQNIAFVKDYLQVAATDEQLPSGVRVENDRTTHQIGVGNSLRYQFTDWLRTKASYEWATRLPSAEEIFGNGVRIQPNPELEPERSHNANLELRLDGLTGETGRWRAGATGFLRRTNQMVVLLGGANSFSYQNVLNARSVGFEAAAGWTAPGDWVAVDLNATYVDLRNVSPKGAFSDYRGDRIPNRPYLYANGIVRLQQTNLFTGGDVLSATFESRYVHDYYRSWESLGRTEFKQVIPSQWLQSVALGYEVSGSAGTLTTSLEVQNLTDANAFDFFGVQRPGRAFYLKTTLEM